jgi:hypothetical protein
VIGRHSNGQPLTLEMLAVLEEALHVVHLDVKLGHVVAGVLAVGEKDHCHFPEVSLLHNYLLDSLKNDTEVG